MTKRKPASRIRCPISTRHIPEITTLGIHDTEADAEAISIVEKNGIRIAMLNFTYGLNNSMPEKRWMVDTLSSQETVCGRIEQAKQEADFVIVFPHWGTEDTFSPDNDSSPGRRNGGRGR